MTDFIAQDPNFKVRIKKSFHAQGLMGHLGAGLVSVSPGTCEIELPFSDAVSQQHGFFMAASSAPSPTPPAAMPPLP